MELDFLVTTSDEVVDNVGDVAVPAGTAEPFVADQTLDDAARRVDATVTEV